MGYKNGTKVLPAELIAQIQQYVDGEYIYIPRTDSNRRKWGSGTDIRRSLSERNQAIYRKYQQGISVKRLSEEYFISTQGIYRILAKYRTEN